MKKSKNKQYLKGVGIGVALCFLTAFIGAGVIYQVVPSEIKSKARYVLGKSVERVRSYHKKPSGDAPLEKVLELKINAQKITRPISPLIYGSNLTSKTEFEMDVAKFGKRTGITNFRFPGGDSSGYRWRLGKYDFQERYDRAPLAKMENVIKFCGIVNAQLVVQVNVESGTANEAAEWVRYMNNQDNMRVDYWELGNEVYGDWDKAFMSGAEYVKVIKEYSGAMKQIDPTIKVGANWGGSKYNDFDQEVIKQAADYIDFVSYHWYPNHINKSHKYKGRYHPLAKEIMANSLAVEMLIDRFKGMIKEYAPEREGKIEFTMMEWDGSWDAVASDLEYEYQGMMWSLANAIFYADALGQFAQNGITVANQYAFQEVMFGFIRGWDKQAGWGGSRWDGKTIRPKALAFKMLAKHFKGNLIESDLKGVSSYHKDSDWRSDSYGGEVPYVSSYVSKATDDRTISIVLINKHEDQDFTINISLNGVQVFDKGEAWVLSGPDLKAQNDGAPDTVKVKKYNLAEIKNKFSYKVLARSVSLIKIREEK